MERLDILCIGNLKEKISREMSAEYEKRLSRYCKLKITELAEYRLPQSPSDAEISRALESEAQAMLAAAGSGGYRIAMCIEGKGMSSEKLAKTLDSAMMTSGRTVIFIGSSCGMSQALKDSCDLKLSMSEMTFPHQLARCMLLEQIYRSYKIRRGETYHK